MIAEVKLLVIYRLFMASSGSWIDIDSRLREIFMLIPENIFSGFSVMTAADLLYLPQVRGNFVYFCNILIKIVKDLLGLQLWHLFKYAELLDVAKQNDKHLVDLLNKF